MKRTCAKETFKTEMAVSLQTVLLSSIKKKMMARWRMLWARGRNSVKAISLAQTSKMSNSSLSKRARAIGLMESIIPTMATMMSSSTRTSTVMMRKTMSRLNSREGLRSSNIKIRVKSLSWTMSALMTIRAMEMTCKKTIS